MENRRRHKRFSATAFLNRPVYLTPLPPFFGHPAKGTLIDLSGGGMAILINEIIPQGTRLNLIVDIFDGLRIDCLVQIRHTIPRNGLYLHGIEFLNLPSVVAEKIERMSSDYIDCESRKSSHASNICRTDCAFFAMCTKQEKINPIFNVEECLELAFKTLEESSLTISPPR